MGFYGKTFVWDSVPSETYNLYVTNFDTGRKDSSGGAGVEIFNQQIYRRPVPYFYGVSQTPVLSFPLTISSPLPIDGATRTIIESWLFGTLSYKKLQIMQCDLDTAYFNAFLTEPIAIYTGNLNYGYECTVVCDAPWAWEFARTLTKSSATAFSFYNLSANNDYLYPSISFTTSSVGNSMSITNTSDASRIFSFTAISPLETITVDNDKKIITSSTGLYRLSKFNKKWFRFVPGLNNLTMTGLITNLSITYQFAKKVGG